MSLDQAVDMLKLVRRIEQLEAALRNARGALATIHNSTEPDAIKHLNYEHLAASIYNCAKDALEGDFVDDMHAAEIYDKLYPRAALAPEKDKNADL